MRAPGYPSAAAVDAKKQSFSYADTIHDTLEANRVVVSCSTMIQTHSVQFR